MTAYATHQVSEHGPGRCSKCFQIVKKLTAKDRLVLGEWDGKLWREHVCPEKSK